jgi:hypothetical protein
MTDLESKLIYYWKALERDIDQEILRRKNYNPGGQHVSVTSELQGASLSSLLVIKRQCKWALELVNNEYLEEIDRKINS